MYNIKSTYLSHNQCLSISLSCHNFASHFHTPTSVRAHKNLIQMQATHILRGRDKFETPRLETATIMRLFRARDTFPQRSAQITAHRQRLEFNHHYPQASTVHAFNPELPGSRFQVPHVVNYIAGLDNLVRPSRFIPKSMTCRNIKEHTTHYVNLTSGVL